MHSKGSILIAVLLLFCLEIFSQPAICSYRYRKRITFNSSQVSGTADLQNFPALINITSDNSLRTVGNAGFVTSNSGFDIVFTASDGVTLLNFQLDKYTATTGEYVAWVSLPTLYDSQNTIIYMYFGNSGVTTNQSSNSVWSNYSGVWHLENGSFVDGTGNGYTLTNNGTTNQAAAAIGGGRADNGTQWLEVANTFPNKNTNFTISGWAYTTNNATGGQRIFCDDVNNTGGYALSIGDGGAGRLRFFSRGSTNIILDSPANTLLSNTWYYCVGVADITNSIRRLYVNGVQVATITSVGWGTDNGNSSVAGETAAGETANRLNGQIDEVRVANSALTADWILTEYRNQSSPGTFYSITALPVEWDGSTNGNFSNNANWVSGASPTSMQDVIIPNVSPANQPNVNNVFQLSSIWIQPGATLTINNTRILAIAYDVTNCGVINGAGTGLLSMNSSSNEIQTQYLSGNGTYNLTNLLINNTFPSPTVTLSKDVNVSSNLVLTSGVVNTTSTNILALGTAASSTSGSATSYVNGPMSKDGTAAFVFPIGKAAKWRRLAISGPTSSSNFRAEYLNAAYSNTSSVNAPLDNISTVEHWQLDRLTGAGNASVSLYWEDASLSGIDNCPDLTIARWNGTGWDERAATFVAGSTCSGTGAGTVTTNAVVTAFSPFTFGSKSNFNPLPIELINFLAKCSGQDVLIQWSTSAEINSNYFLIEKSTDGSHWETISKVKAAGNSKQKINYEFIDSQNSRTLNYYKLIQFDFDGRKEEYPVISVGQCISVQGEFFIYPNPAEHNVQIKVVSNAEKRESKLRIINALGDECLEQPFYLETGTTEFLLPLQLAPGIYFIQITSGDISFPSKKLLVE